jgi:hypothetical protein
MDLREKTLEALNQAVPIDYAWLDDDEGVSGLVVSDAFDGMSMLDRQLLIERALRESGALSPEENRQILMIAGLSPAEYDVVRPATTVEIKKGTKGWSVLVHGGAREARSVQMALREAGFMVRPARRLIEPAAAVMELRVERTPRVREGMTLPEALRSIPRVELVPSRRS